jgi:hypothetical protein
MTMTSRLLGSYHREPVETPVHRVKVEAIEENVLVWKPEGRKGWTLTVSPDDENLLLCGDDCPEDCKQVTVELEEDVVIGLRYDGELYTKADYVVDLPEDLEGDIECYHQSHDDEEGSDAAVVVDDDEDYEDDEEYKEE